MTRAYCAICRFPGRDQFYLGTVFADASAKQHEIEPLIADLMDRLFPTRPELVNIVPGMLVFRGEER